MRKVFVGLLPLVAACSFQEDVGYVDLVGTVRIPKDALQLELADPDSGEIRTVEIDVRGLGPVYLGAYSGVEEGQYDFEHPKIGPILDDTHDGNAYPYGGTTVGHFEYGCYQELVCKVVTGRYTTYDEILDFFANTVGDPVTNQNNEDVGSGVEFQEQCFDTYEVTADFEVGILADEPDFIDTGDYLEAEVEMLHVKWLEGLSVFGWVDQPSATFDFVTCDEGIGDYYSEYTEQYYTGTNVAQVLNYPGRYIDDGDYVAVGSPAVMNADEEFVINLDFHYQD